MGSMMAARVLLDDCAVGLHERRSQPTMHHAHFSRQVHILVDGAWRLPRRCPPSTCSFVIGKCSQRAHVVQHCCSSTNVVEVELPCCSSRVPPCQNLDLSKGTGVDERASAVLASTLLYPGGGRCRVEAPS